MAKRVKDILPWLGIGKVLATTRSELAAVMSHRRKISMAQATLHEWCGHDYFSPSLEELLGQIQGRGRRPVEFSPGGGAVLLGSLPLSLRLTNDGGGSYMVFGLGFKAGALEVFDLYPGAHGRH
jgi:hypothetical protein